MSKIPLEVQPQTALENSVLAEGQTESVEDFRRKFRFRRSFLSRLIQGGGNIQNVYTAVKNYLLQYVGVKSRQSWGGETFYYKRTVIAKLGIRGKSLYIYLGLTEEEVSTLRIDEWVQTSKYQGVPAKIKITGSVKQKRAFKAISVIAARVGLTAEEIPTQTYYYPYESDEQLLKKGYIKRIENGDEPIAIAEEAVAATEEVKREEAPIENADLPQKPSNGKRIAKKIVDVTLRSFTYVFFLFCMLALVLSISIKKDADGAATVFGRQMRIVATDSMERCAETDVSGYKIKDIPVNSMVWIEVAPTDEEKAEEWYSKLQVGDVLTFRYVYARQETITHRITNITKKETGGYIIQLAGDNKSSNARTLTQVVDTSLTDSPNYVIGKVTGKSYFVGTIITEMKSPAGLIGLVLIPSLIIAIYEIVRLFSVLMAEKNKRHQDETQTLRQELAYIRKELELLRQNQAQMPLVIDNSTGEKNPE